MEEWSDRELVERIVAGEARAFTVLVERFHTLIYSIAYRMVGDVAEAQDLSQEVFLRIYRQIGQYDPALPLRPWVRRIACNLTLNHLRHRHPTLQISQGDDGQELSSPSPNQEQMLLAESRNRRLQRALMELPEHYRLAFTLKYVEDMTSLEIAEVMQTNQNTVKTWLVRAREALRRSLNDL